jgi:hypothetical protein
MIALFGRTLSAAAALLFLVLCAPPVLGEGGSDGEEVVDATVSAMTPDGVYLDRGRDAGLAVGDRVTVIPLGGASLEGTVRVVSSQAARVEIPGGPEGVQVGDRAEVRVLRARLAAAQTSTGSPEPAPRDVPAHPPWTSEEGPWSDETPLLAPVAARTPAERDRSFSGRAYVRAEAGTDDQAGQNGSNWSLLWTGGKLDVRNPFGRGGELQLDLDAFARSFDDDEDSDSESRLRVDRLSYALGGDRERPTRWEVGRFLHEAVPEFGVLDGVAWDRRLPSGDHVGVSAGFLADWDDGQATGDDAGLQAWYRYVADDDGTLTSTVGVQKTWHEGEADRDLLVWTADWRPFERTYLRGSAWVDLYTSGDTKEGVELTQALVTATHRFESGNGLSLTATHYAFPDLLRNGLFEATAEDVLDTEVTRVSLRGWRDLTETLRLDGTASAFTDQDDSGGSADVGLTASELLWERGSVSLHVFDVEGKASSGLGVRASASKRFDLGALRLDVSATDYDGGALAGTESLSHQRARLGWDMDLGTHWSLSVHAEERFGDQQDSSAIGFYLQRRF